MSEKYDDIEGKFVKHYLDSDDNKEKLDSSVFDSVFNTEWTPTNVRDGYNNIGKPGDILMIDSQSVAKWQTPKEERPAIFTAPCSVCGKQPDYYNYLNAANILCSHFGTEHYVEDPEERIKTKKQTPLCSDIYLAIQLWNQENKEEKTGE